MMEKRRRRRKMILSLPVIIVLVTTITNLTTSSIISTATATIITEDAAAAAAAENNHVHENDDGADEEDGCTLFMAPSIIPNAGLGLFTTKAYSESNMALHDVIPDIVIPFGSPYKSDTEDIQEEFRSDELLGGLKRYDWISHLGQDILSDRDNNADNIGAGDMYAPFEEGMEYIFEFWPGFGALLNHESHYRNIDYASGPLEENIPATDQQSRPHVGSDAFTSFHHKFVQTIQPILEGGELFSSYGEGYFLHKRNNPYWFVPLSEDYKEAKRIMKFFYNRHRKQNADDSLLSSLQEEWNIILERYSNQSPRVKTALPHNVTRLMETQGMEFSLGKNQRSTTWIRKEGLCIDGVRIGVSNIYEAGRGIFAKFPIAKDTVIVPVPVIQVNRTLQTLPHPLADDNDNSNNKSLPSHRLIVNYCLSHHKSSMMLCPYLSTVALVNHSSDPSKINAKLILSTSKYMNSTILEETPQELLTWDRSQRSLGLVFDIVAIRDILPGEEIYINYGNEWQTAWNQHLDKWSNYYNNVNDTITEKEKHIFNQPDSNRCPDTYSSSTTTSEISSDDGAVLPYCCSVRYDNTIINHDDKNSSSGNHSSDKHMSEEECIQSFVEKILKESPLERHYHTPSTACFYYPYWNEDENLLYYEEALEFQETQKINNNTTTPKRDLRNYETMKAFEWRYEYYHKDWMIDDDDDEDEDDDDDDKPLIKTSTVGGLYPCHILAREKSVSHEEDKNRQSDADGDDYFTVLMLIDHDMETMEGLDYDIVEDEVKDTQQNDDEEEEEEDDGPGIIKEIYNQGPYTRRQVQLVTHVPAKAIRYGLTQQLRDLGVVDHTTFLYKTIREQNGLVVPPPRPPSPFRHYIGVPDDVFPEAWKDL